MAMTARRKHSKQHNICIGLAKKSPRFSLKQIQIFILFVFQLKLYYTIRPYFLPTSFRFRKLDNFQMFPSAN